MEVRLLRAAERIATPWRNGGGVTREIAASPPGVNMADFDWRVSMAEVAADGPFSAFPGVDRVLTVLNGVLQLTLQDASPITLDPAALPFAFPGDIPCHGAVRGSAVTDLNVMVRRDRFTCAVRRAHPGPLHPAGAAWLFVALAPGALRLANQTCTLATHDAVLVHGAAGEPAANHTAGVEIVVSERG